MFTVYILQSNKTGKFYIGYTKNLQLRLIFHNNGLNKSTKYGIPWKIIYTELFQNLQDATRREKFLKQQRNRTFYNKLIISSSDAPSTRGLGA